MLLKLSNAHLNLPILPKAPLDSNLLIHHLRQAIAFMDGHSIYFFWIILHYFGPSYFTPFWTATIFQKDRKLPNSSKGPDSACQPLEGPWLRTWPTGSGVFKGIQILILNSLVIFNKNVLKSM